MGASSDLKTVQPVAVGGIGGSGTRLIAEILRRAGLYMGGDLNETNDTLWFTLLFKRTELLGNDAEFARGLDVFVRAMCGTGEIAAEDQEWLAGLAQHDRLQHDASWLRERANTLLAALASRNAGDKDRPRTRWGWKEPNTHIFLDKLQSSIPRLEYIHVMRNGLDMAFSSNQNQPQMWGPCFVRDMPFEPSPRYSLKYWCLMQKRAIHLGQAMGARFLLLNYDAFCDAPREGLETLLRFLGCRVDEGEFEKLAGLVQEPSTRGRFKRHALDEFDAEDVAYVASLGYETGMG